ncbi:hypothetical protein D3C87_836220 [compost metagenome]
MVRNVLAYSFRYCFYIYALYSIIHFPLFEKQCLYYYIGMFPSFDSNLLPIEISGCGFSATAGFRWLERCKTGRHGAQKAKTAFKP